MKRRDFTILAALAVSVVAHLLVLSVVYHKYRRNLSWVTPDVAVTKPVDLSLPTTQPGIPAPALVPRMVQEDRPGEKTGTGDSINTVDGDKPLQSVIQDDQEQSLMTRDPIGNASSSSDGQLAAMLQGTGGDNSQARGPGKPSENPNSPTLPTPVADASGPKSTAKLPDKVTQAQKNSSPDKSPDKTASDKPDSNQTLVDKTVPDNNSIGKTPTDKPADKPATNTLASNNATSNVNTKTAPTEKTPPNTPPADQVATGTTPAGSKNPAKTTPVQLAIADQALTITPPLDSNSPIPSTATKVNPTAGNPPTLLATNVLPNPKEIADPLSVGPLALDPPPQPKAPAADPAAMALQAALTGTPTGAAAPQAIAQGAANLQGTAAPQVATNPASDPEANPQTTSPSASPAAKPDSAQPTAVADAGGVGGAASGQTHAGTPLPSSDYESVPVSSQLSFQIVGSKVVAQQGRKVRTTVMPRLDLAAWSAAASYSGLYVTLAVRCDASGNVTRDDEVIHPSGSDGIDLATEAAVAQWWFEPPTDAKTGKPIPHVYLVSIRF